MDDVRARGTRRPGVERRRDASQSRARRCRGRRQFGENAPVLLLPDRCSRALAFFAALRRRLRRGLRQRRVLDFFARDRGASGWSGPGGIHSFWTVIGISGLAGGAAGDLVRRFGLTPVLQARFDGRFDGCLVLALAYSLWLMPAQHFGSTYIMLTGVILVWSVGVLPRETGRRGSEPDFS